MVINRNKISAFVIEFFIMAVLYIVRSVFENSDKDIQIIMIAICGIFVIVQTLLLVDRLKHGFDCYSILIVMIAVFMFGQHILFMIGSYPKDMMLLRDRVSKEAYYDAGFLVLYSIILMNIGYIFTCKSMNNVFLREKNAEFEGKNEDGRKIVYSTGKIFFLISVVPTCITLLRNIYLTFTVGYGSRIVDASYQLSGVNNIIGVLASLMIPSLFALFIGKKPGEKFAVIVLSVYLILYTLSGSRINTVILLVGVLYIQSRMFTRLNLRKILKYSLMGMVLLLVLSTVSVARNSINSSLGKSSVILDSIEEVVDNNIIVSAVAEAGYTFSATAVVVDNCPENVEYNNGKSYLRALAYIVPNELTGNYYAKVGSVDDKFKEYLNQYGSGIGSSFIAEAYYNFGYFSLAIMPLFGILIGKLSSALDLSIIKKNYLGIFFFTYIFTTVSFYVRSETSTFFRNIIWFGLPFLVIARVLKDKYKRK